MSTLYPTAQQLRRVIDAARGSFSFVTDMGVRLTYDMRRSSDPIMLAREWRESVISGC